jgi:hypothetical protein
MTLILPYENVSIVLLTPLAVILAAKGKLSPINTRTQYFLSSEAFTHNGPECILVLLFSSLLPVVCTYETILFV